MISTLPRVFPLTLSAGAVLLLLAGCGDNARLDIAGSTGPHPSLPPPKTSLIPTVHVAEASSWAVGEKPTAAEGLAVTEFASGLDHPRWVYTLPNGDILVAESNGPERPDDSGGVQGWFVDFFQRKAGATAPSADRITLLRDADGDGAAEVKTAFLEGLHSPFGMTLVGDTLYVANTDAIVRFPYWTGETSIAAPGEKVVDLPAGPINHHWTKNVIANRDGKRLFVTIGSNSNVAENGLTAEFERAAIWEVDPATGLHKVFASGIRNPNGMDLEPTTGTLWTVANERDMLGGDLVPDYLTSVQEGGFYGWPFSYYGQHVDDRVEHPRPDLVAKAIAPDYALGAHTASLGLTFAKGAALGPQFAEGAFVGQHGSWNRKPRSGYKVIFVPFRNGKPLGGPVDVLTGFIGGDDKARGRPVGVDIDKRGGLMVADDVGNIIWRVAAADPKRTASAEATR